MSRSAAAMVPAASMAPAGIAARAQRRTFFWHHTFAAGATAAAAPDTKATGPDFEAAGPDLKAAGPDFDCRARL